MPILAFIEFLAAANAIMLAAAMLWSSRFHRTRARNRFAGFLFCYGWLLTTFMLVDQGWLQPTKELQLIDDTIGLLTGALFLDYFLGALGRGPMPAWAYMPAATYVVASLFFGSFVAENVHIGHVIAVYVGYTSMATYVYMQARKFKSRKPPHLIFLLTATWLVHVAQFARLSWPSVSWIFDSVPVIGTLFLIGLTFLIMTDSRALRDYLGPVRPGPGDDTRILEQLNTLMLNEKHFLDPQLSLESLAIALNLSARQLSEIINKVGGSNFYDYVNRYRVEEAQKLMCDAAEARTSIEAVGLLVGFRARSTFYEAFRRETGQTPGEYRRSRSS